MDRASNFLVGLGLVLAAIAPSVFAASTGISQQQLKSLATLTPGQEQRIENFPVGASRSVAIRLRPVQIYSSDAHVYVIDADGKREIPRSNRIFLRGRSDDGGASVAISLNADSTFVGGAGNGPDGQFVLHAEPSTSGAITLSAQSVESALPPGFQFNSKCGDEDIPFVSRAHDSVEAQLARATNPTTNAVTATSALRGATVAIDTDSLFMSRLFSNNTTSATNWIAGMFNTMNTMYENDLQVQLLIGTTILRTNSATDPYANFAQGAADATKLNFFANYWHTNESTVPRAFATLLSGLNASTTNSCSASGIAEIDAYCNTSFSYSVNQVCTSINIDPNGAFDATIVGHELGHNFGAYHTHCTDVSNGDAPVATNTIDQCVNSEKNLGCYGGATTSCPAAGRGTIMSYCNMGVCGAVQNLLQFHPTQINDVLLPAIAANTPSCLSIDDIFKNGFE
jgi:hypothetical protein